jgi:hypothetical protein
LAGQSDPACDSEEVDVAEPPVPGSSFDIHEGSSQKAHYRRSSPQRADRCNRLPLRAKRVGSNIVGLLCQPAPRNGASQKCPTIFLMPRRKNRAEKNAAKELITGVD